MLDGTSWDDWIATIQGPHLGRCGVTTVQRRCLLDLALTYRAFASGTAGIDNIWFTFFVRSPINIARSHRNDEPVDVEIERLTRGLRATLPPVRPASCTLFASLIFSTLQNIFVSSDIPPVTEDEDSVASSQDTSTSYNDEAIATIHSPVSISVYPHTALLPFHNLHGRSPHPSINHTNGTRGHSTGADGRDYSYLSEDPDSG